MSQSEIATAARRGNLLIVGAPGSGVTTALNEAVDAVGGPLTLIDPLYMGTDVHVLHDRAVRTAFDNGYDIDRGPCLDALFAVAEGVVVIDNFDFLIENVQGEDDMAMLLHLFIDPDIRLIATGLYYGNRPNVDSIPALGFDSVAFMFRDGDIFDSVVVSA